MHNKAQQWARNWTAARSRIGYRRYLGLSALFSLAVVAGGLLAKQFAAAGYHVHHCMDAGQVGSWLGMRLQLLQASPDCPSGVAASSGESALNVVFSVSLPLVLLTLLGGGTVFALSGKLLRLLGRAARQVLPQRCSVRISTVARVQQRIITHTFSVLHAQLVANLHWRGPPTLAAV